MKANKIKIFKNNFNKNGFYVISLPDEIKKFWTIENIRRLDPFVTETIFNKCNENYFDILELFKNKDLKMMGK